MVWKSLHHLKRPSGYLNATRATGGNQQIRPRLCGRVAGQIGVLKRSDVAAGEGLKSLSHLKWPSGYLRPNCFLPSWQHVWIYFFWADNLGGLKKKLSHLKWPSGYLRPNCFLPSWQHVWIYFFWADNLGGLKKKLSHLKWPSGYLRPNCFLPSWQHVWIYFFWADNLGGLKKKLSHLKWPSGYLRPNYCFLPSWQHVWIFWADNLGGLKIIEPFEVAFWVLESMLFPCLLWHMKSYTHGHSVCDQACLILQELGHSESTKYTWNTQMPWHWLFWSLSQASMDLLPFKDEKPLHGPHVGLNQILLGLCWTKHWNNLCLPSLVCKSPWALLKRSAGQPRWLACRVSWLSGPQNTSINESLVFRVWDNGSCTTFCNSCSYWRMSFRRWLRSAWLSGAKSLFIAWHSELTSPASANKATLGHSGLSGLTDCSPGCWSGSRWSGPLATGHSPSGTAFVPGEWSVGRSDPVVPV